VIGSAIEFVLRIESSLHLVDCWRPEPDSKDGFGDLYIIELGTYQRCVLLARRIDRLLRLQHVEPLSCPSRLVWKPHWDVQWLSRSLWWRARNALRLCEKSAARSLRLDTDRKRCRWGIVRVWTL